MLEITERDEKLIRTLAEYVSIYTENAKIIYGEYKDYPRKRIKKLINENYILRKNAMLYLGYKGREYLEEYGIEARKLPGEKEYRKRYAEIYKLFTRLNKFTLVPSWRMERRTKTFAYKYYGQIYNSNSKPYLVYRLSKLVSKENDEKFNKEQKHSKELEILKIKNELLEIVERNELLGIRGDLNIIVFIEDKDTTALYKKNARINIVKEQIIIPYTDSGLALINKTIGDGEGENERVIQELTEKKFNVRRKDAASTIDFYVDNVAAFNLCTSDYNKELRLKNYIETLRRQDSAVIVCHKIQERKYATEYPNCRIISIE